MKLDAEEKAILEAYEQEEWVSIADPDEIEKVKQAARNTFKKDKRISIRISASDLERLQEKAMMEGLPYQTLISSILHKYIHGRLIEK